MEVLQSFMTMIVFFRRIIIILMMLDNFSEFIIMHMSLFNVKNFCNLTAITIGFEIILPFDILIGFLLSTFLPVITNNNFNWVRLPYCCCRRTVALFLRILALWSKVN